MADHTLGMNPLWALSSTPLTVPARPAHASAPTPQDQVTLGDPHPYKGHKDRTPEWTRGEIAWMRQDVQNFEQGLPAQGPVRQALDSVLQDMTVEEPHSLDSTYSQLHSVRVKLDRVRESSDPIQAMQSEHLEAPIPNYGEVQPGVLYRGAQPSRQGLQWLAQQGIKTVVSLRMPGLEDSYGYVDFLSGDEAKECDRLGMRGINLPATDGGEPSPEQIQEFLRIVRDPANQPVFVHCAEGKGRTGIMVGAFERTQGKPWEQVQGDLGRFGLDGHSQVDLTQLAYIRDLDV